MVDYSYLRRRKAELLKRWHEIPFEKRNDLRADVYKNAVVFPLRKVGGDNLLFGRGGVADSEGCYIEESGIRNRIHGLYECSQEDYRDEKVVYCGYLVDQWGHFLVEATARLWYYLENDETVDKYIFFVGENAPCKCGGNYREFFELLGVWDKTEIINKPTRFREVIVPELGYKTNVYYSDKYKSIYNAVSENATADTEQLPRKIYFSRSMLPGVKKKEFGYDMLDSYFEANGYTIVYPEKATLSELIVLLRNADEIASLSGSLPHNLLFARDGKRVVIVERNVLNNEIQADINRIKDIDAVYIDANIPIYTINLGYGPFIMAYNEYLDKFTKERGYKPAKKKFMTGKYLKRNFKKYMKAYNEAYGYRWFMEEWQYKYADYLYEGYLDGVKYFGEYLNGSAPFRLSHYFRIRCWKSFAKKILKK